MHEASLLWDRRELAGTEDEEKKRAHQCGADTRMKIKSVGRGRHLINLYPVCKALLQCSQKLKELFIIFFFFFVDSFQRLWLYLDDFQIFTA